MKLTKRLTALADHVQGPYQSIWDCCCDHGLLGMALLQADKAQQVHFVDCIPSITEKLQLQLNAKFANGDRYQVHTIDVLDLPLTQSSLEECAKQQPQLIIIAGVGGEQTLQMVLHLTKRFKHLNLEFLLCPVRHQYQLRQVLLEQTFSEGHIELISEQLVEENKRFYEIIHIANYPVVKGAVNLKPLMSLNSTGSILWQPFGPIQQRYLTKVIMHWQRTLLRFEPDSEEYNQTLAILKDYQAL